MQIRSEYTGPYAIEAPDHLKRAMVARGGMNPYGEPNYRLVRAEGRKRLSGGRWHEWLPGTDVAHKVPGLHRAWRSFIGYKPIPMYPGEHRWVLERWFPPDAYGTPDRWYLPVTLGGTVRWIDGENVLSLGDYPSMGDWESANFWFYDSELSEALVLHAVGMIERRLIDVPQSYTQRLVEETVRAEEEEAAREREYDRMAEEIMGEEDNLFDARTPGGQAELCRLCESIGIREHPF